MRRRMTYRPSKGASIFGGVVGIIFVIIGLTMAIPMAGLFGILWTAIAVGITIYNFYLAFGNGSMGSIEIDDGTAGTPTPPPQAADNAARLAELRTLYDQRLITQEEYEEKRKEILKEL